MDVAVSISDGLGKRVVHGNYAVQQGMQTIPLNIWSLSRGIYSVKILTASGVNTVRFYKN